MLHYAQHSQHLQKHRLEPKLIFSILKSYSKRWTLVNNFFMLQMCNVSAFVRVDAELEDSSVYDVSQTENVIVSQWRDVSADEQHEVHSKVNEVLRLLGFNATLLVISRANSIALNFICLTLSAVMSLRDQWRSRQLRYIVGKLFTLLSTPSDTVSVKRLIWPLTDYEQRLFFFRSVQGKESSCILCIRN